MALTPQAVLESLNEHLSHYAKILPALHAQLGLPGSSLSLELEQMQSTLCGVVEAQLTTRQKEVNDWMSRCDRLEKDCLELVKCLGSNARTTLSVGELRKIQVLPKRFEELQTCQEQLGRIYNTKTEQLNGLIKRFHSLTHTLGTSFFHGDLLLIADPFSATSDHLLDLDTHVIGPPQRLDVTPERFQRLEKELLRGKSEITARLQQLSKTLEMVVWFHSELGRPLPALEPTPRNSEADDLYNVPSSSSSSSISFGGFNQILARFVARWEEAEDEALNGGVLGVEGVNPTDEVMTWAEELLAELEGVKTQREAYIQNIFDQLESLWRRLGQPDEEIDDFIDQNRGSTEEVVLAYEEELERMHQARRQKMSVFIINAREEVLALWDTLMFSEEERDEFTPFRDDEHTEELLARHEEEIAKLKEEIKIRAPIMASYNKYRIICEEERQLAEWASDQSRLLGRGPRDPGRLLREEKMRKRVKKEKPKLEQELLRTIPAWESERGRYFYVDGVRVMDALRESAELEASKENKKKPATKALPPRAITPGPGSTAKMPPGSRKHAATPSSVQSQAGPSKRMRTTTGQSVFNRTSVQTPTCNNNGMPPPSFPPHKVLGLSARSNTPASSHSKLGLGHPGGIKYAPPSRSVTAPARTTTTIAPAPRTTSGTAAMRMAVARKRESFRPRPSMDVGAMVYGLAAYNGAAGVMVKEEEDDDDMWQ